MKALGRILLLVMLVGGLMVTDPAALQRLLDLEPAEHGSLALRIFECTDEIGFHPKAYLLHAAENAGAAYVGSSNLTAQGLDRGIEWNYRVEPSQDAGGRRTPRGAIRKRDKGANETRTRPLRSSYSLMAPHLHK